MKANFNISYVSNDSTEMVHANNLQLAYVLIDRDSTGKDAGQIYFNTQVSGHSTHNTYFAVTNFKETFMFTSIDDLIETIKLAGGSKMDREDREYKENNS